MKDAESVRIICQENATADLNKKREDQKFLEAIVFISDEKMRHHFPFEVSLCCISLLLLGTSFPDILCLETTLTQHKNDDANDGERKRERERERK
jgi:hypothetical protein